MEDLGYVTVTEAAEILGLTPRAVEWRIKEGKIQRVRKIGRMWLIPKSEVERELAEREGKPKAGRPPRPAAEPEGDQP